jgi:hypothetical protein
MSIFGTPGSIMAYNESQGGMQTTTRYNVTVSRHEAGEA